MKDLTMHIVDIVQNSVRAEAENVVLAIEIGEEMLSIKIIDDGCGMDAETLEKVTDPFYTSRTTRKVGLGIPLMKQNAELTGGEVKIASIVGEGTEFEATFGLTHWDRPPMGNLPETVAMTMTGNPSVNLMFSCSKGEASFAVSTAEVKEILGDDVNISQPKITSFLKDMIAENLKELEMIID